MTLKKTAAIAVAAVCVAGAAAGCSSSGSKISGGSSGGSSSTGGSSTGGGGQTDLAGYVTKAAGNCSSSSAKMSLNMNISAAGTSTTMTGSGVEDPATKSAQMQISMAIPGAGNLAIQEVVSGKTVYMKSDVFGDKWIKLDLAQLAGNNSLGTATDPCSTLSMLKNVPGTAVTKLGDDTVNGESATHYQVKLDINTLLANSPLKKLVDQLGSAGMPSTIPLDLWIDGQGRPARLVMDLAFTIQGQSIKEDLTIDLHDWGTPVSVTAPDPSQVEDAPQSLLSGLLGSGTT